MAERTRVYLVRHGENPANLTKEFSYRHVDYPLTDKGRLQARQTGLHLAGVAFDAMWTSPLKRAYETAAEVARHQASRLHVEESFREMNVGDLEGAESLDTAWGVYADTMRHWLAGRWEQRFPGGESRTELISRFRRALETATQGRAGQTVLVVGHGGIFTHGVAHLCRIADERAFFSRENHNCSISILDVWHESETRFELVEWATIGHLSGEAAVLVESVPEAFRAKRL